MKKQNLIIVIAVVLLLAVGTVYAEVPTLTVWDFKVAAGDASAKALKDLDVMFEAANGVKVNHVGYPSDPTYYSTLQAAAAANQGPDVVMFHADSRVAPFESVLLTLNKDVANVRAQFTPASLAACSIPTTSKGALKLLPMTSQGFGIYYNKALFKKAGLNPEKAPKSSAEFLAACEKLKDAGIVPILTGKDYTFDFLFRALVANVVGPNYASLATSDSFAATAQFKEAATFMKTLVDKGYIEKAGLTRPYFMEAIDSFAAGNGAMFVGLLSDVGNWKAFSDGQGITNIGYFPTVNLPGSKYKDQQVSQPAGIGFGVFTWTKQSKLAIAYIKFVTTGNGANRFSTASGAVSPNMMIDTAKIPYPVLASVIGYMKNGFSQDCMTMAQPNFENDLLRLNDQAFVIGSMPIDQYVKEIQKAFHSK